MTNNQLNRERLEKIKSWRETYGAGSNVMLPAEEAEELARFALAALDSEPVAWTWQHLDQWHVTNDEERARDLAWDGVKVEPLYRHAQQPVVPDEKPVPNPLKMYAVDAVAAIAEVRGWNACRAAILQAGNSPVIPDGYVMVPKEMTDEIGEAIAMQANCCGGIALDIYDAMLAAAPQEVK
ncbi:TPA: DUF551 domain-containing protein [Klebsiella oxytoca]|nr:DUF551 domain-containing protein [Klebsiella oxytoca]